MVLSVSRSGPSIAHSLAPVPSGMAIRPAPGGRFLSLPDRTWFQDSGFQIAGPFAARLELSQIPQPAFLQSLVLLGVVVGLGVLLHRISPRLVFLKYLALAGCVFDTGGVALPDANKNVTVHDAAPLPDRTDGTSVPDTGPADGRPVDAGGYSPYPTRPMEGLLLAPTRAYLRWGVAGMPPAMSIDHFQICFTTEGSGAIEAASVCPNPLESVAPYTVLDPLLTSASYLWKVRSCYDAAGADCSDYSPVAGFSTDDSLIGWWKFDDGSGSVAVDSSGHGFDGTLVGADGLPVWSGGLVGGALLFDGVDDFVNIPITPLIETIDNGDFTIEGFGNPSSVDSAIQLTLVNRGDNCGLSSNNFYQVRLNNPLNQLTFQYRVGETSVLTAPTPTSISSWFHFGAVREIGEGASLYQDGVLVASSSTDNGLAFDWGGEDRPLLIGATEIDAPCSPNLWPFDGLLDEVAIYNRGLSEEVSRNNFCAAQSLTGASPLPAVCE